MNRNFQATSDFAQCFHLLARKEGKLNRGADILEHPKFVFVWYIFLYVGPDVRNEFRSLLDDSVSPVGNDN